MIDAISRVTIGSDSISTATVAFFQHNVLLGVVISAVLVALGVEPLHNIIGKIEKVGKKKS